jgi:hypothetical protein
MRLYSLAINGDPLAEVEIDTPAWLPVCPRLNQNWLRSFVTRALQRYFNSCVVKT